MTIKTINRERPSLRVQKSKSIELPNGLKVISEKGLPNRKQMLDQLQKNEEFDVLIIGGGASGSGVAVGYDSCG